MTSSERCARICGSFSFFPNSDSNSQDKHKLARLPIFVNFSLMFCLSCEKILMLEFKEIKELLTTLELGTITDVFTKVDSLEH